MKKIPKIVIRLFVTFIVAIFILCMVHTILEIKHKDRLKTFSKEWNWKKENDVIFNMQFLKYPLDEDENFMMVMRRDEDIPEKKPGEKRIFVIGDSFVSGYGGTNVNYTWWKQLNLLIKEAGYSNVNIYAAGRFFINTKDQLETVLKNEKLMKKIDPDLIIMGYVQNDPEERDETNLNNLVKEDWEVNLEEIPLYKRDPVLYYEYVDRMNSLDSEKDFDKLMEMGELLGYYRYDVRTWIISSGERLERYKELLKEVDEKIKSYNIPYFYYFLDNIDSTLIKNSYINVYNAMTELGIKAYHKPFKNYDFRKEYNLSEDALISVNPGDPHPGIAVTYEFGKRVYNILKDDYSFIFENSVYQDINELDLNINDTMPFVSLDKKQKNTFEFVYPKDQFVTEVDNKWDKGEGYNFLYYPIKKKYIKLNLEYPKNVSKIIITADGLKESEIYVNTIDEEYNFDIDEAYQKLTPCKKINDTTYDVNKKITSVNLALEFNKFSDRKVRIEFVE